MIEIKTIAECDESSLVEFISLADVVFLQEKFRVGSFLYRYPSLFQSGNFQNLFAAWSDGQLLGTTAVREFDIEVHGRNFRGAMIGLVGVHRNVRRMGIGKAIVTRVSQVLSSRDLDFSVLWTTSHEFYCTLGWQFEDQGILGHCRTSPPFECCLDERRLSDWAAQIEEIRKLWQPIRLCRSTLDYSVIPASVDEVICLETGGKAIESAYSIIGVRGSLGFVYEIVGNPRAFERLWQDICGRFSEVYVNDCQGSPSHDWLTRNTPLVWLQQNLAVWLTKGNCAARRAIYIPYFDRI